MVNLPTKVRGLVALTLMAVGSTCSSAAFAQVQYFQRNGFLPGPKKEDRKLNFLYRASDIYLSVGTALDATSTVRILDHPTVASRPDGTVLARYYGLETGWASCFGRQNASAVVAANVALNVGINLLSRRLYRRGGRWRILAITVNVLKGTDSLVAGIHNVRRNADVDRQIRVAAGGYSGPIVWSH